MNEKFEPLLPALGQKVASWANNAEPSFGSRKSWKLECLMKSPDPLADSNETHELLASPGSTIQVASAFTVAELLEVTLVIPTSLPLVLPVR
jgi:hypothetical protein